MTDTELKYLRALQPEIKKILGDVVFFLDKQQDSKANPYTLNYETLFIPLAIDPENPERGCWVC